MTCVLNYQAADFWHAGKEGFVLGFFCLDAPYTFRTAFRLLIELLA